MKTYYMNGFPQCNLRSLCREKMGYIIEPLNDLSV